MNWRMAHCPKRFCVIKDCHGIHIVTCILLIVESLCNSGKLWGLLFEDGWGSEAEAGGKWAVVESAEVWVTCIWNLLQYVLYQLYKCSFFFFFEFHYQGSDCKVQKFCCSACQVQSMRSMTISPFWYVVRHTLYFV